MRRRAIGGFQSVLAVELEGDLGEARREGLRAAWRERLASEPRAGARLVRRFGFGPLALAPRGAALPAPHVRSAAAPDLTSLAIERLLAPLDPAADPLVDLELEDAGGTTRLALRWWHPVMDERGAELLLRGLEARERATPRAAPSAGPTDVPAKEGWRERREAFSNARRRLDELTRGDPYVLPPPARGAAAPDAGGAAAAPAWRAECDVLEPDLTRRLLAASDARYGLRGEGLAQIGLLLAALADLAPDDAELSLPASVQLRPPRARAPLFGNALTFLWYALPAATARDPGLRAEALRTLARAKVAGGEGRDAEVLLAAGRFMPLPIYRRELTRRAGAPRFTTGISTLGELLGGARELFGLPLRDALALTSFPVPPGVGAVFSRVNGSMRIATLHAPAQVDSRAARRLHERLLVRARELAG